MEHQCTRSRQYDLSDIAATDAQGCFHQGQGTGLQVCWECSLINFV
jgi:hypothetical protein